MGIEVDGANQKLILDSDGDTYIEGATDDTLKVYVSGAQDFTISANTLTAESGSTIAAQALTATTVTASGIVKTDDATEATSTTDGSLQTDGGLSVVKDAVFGDDIKLLSDSSVIHFGADSEVTLTHTNDTGLTLNYSFTAANSILINGSTPTLTIGDAGAEDTKIVFDGNAQDFHIGLDDTDDDFKIGLGSTLGTTAHIVIDEAGCVTKPLQPAFLAVSSANNISNVATDASDVTIPFPTEVFDNNADYNTSTYQFTAPVTGRYQFNSNLMVSDMDAAATYVRFRLVASNRNIDIDIFEPNLSADASRWTVKGSALVDMDANDTVHMVIAQYQGTAQMDSDSTNSTFSGYLVC